MSSFKWTLGIGGVRSLTWTLGYSRFGDPGTISFSLSGAGLSIPPGTVAEGNAMANAPEVDPSPDQSDVPILERIVGALRPRIASIPTSYFHELERRR